MSADFLKFRYAAWNKLHGSAHRERADVEAVDRALRSCFEDGFSLRDAVEYCRLTEHISPNLSEEYACKRIGEIAEKYRPKKKKGKR